MRFTHPWIVSTRSRRAMSLAAASLLAVGAVGCGSSTGSAASSGSGGSKGPIVIGMSASETGADSVDGMASLLGNKYGVKAINASGGWLGRKVKLIVLNDNSDPTQAQQDYTKLITQDHVKFLIGPYAPTLAAPAGELATRYHVVDLDPETALPPVPGSRWAILAEPPTQKYMEGYPSLVAKAGYHTIAILGINNAFGEICAKAQKAQAIAAGLKVVYTTYYSATDNLASAAQAIKAAKADAVDQCSFFTDGVGLVRALNQVGYRPKMLGLTIAPSEPTFTSSVGHLATDVISTTSWEPNLSTQGNSAFVKGFTKMFGHAPDYHAANNYAAMQALGDAIEAAHSTNENAVLKALYNSSFHTVLGTFKLSSSGAASSYAMYLYQLQNRKQKLIYPSSVAQAKVRVPYAG